jgi:hypothetical protein
MAGGTNRSEADPDGARESSPSRRALLKAAALSAAGAGIGMPLASGAVPAFAATPGGGTEVKPQRPASPGHIASTAFSYRSTSGLQFTPVDTTVTSKSVGNFGAIAQLSGSPTMWTTPIHIPDRSVLSSATFTVLVNDASPAQVQVFSLNSSVPLGSTTVSTSSPSFQQVPVSLTAGNVTIDNFNDAYFLAWTPGTATVNHQLQRGQAVFFNEGRLATFLNPRRVFDGNANPTAPGTYGPIDATVQVTTSGWPGGASGVVVGAQAAFCAVQSFSSGVMTLYPDGASDPGIANWSGTTDGPLNMTYMLVPLSVAGKFRIHKLFTGRAFVDVWGYLL